MLASRKTLENINQINRRFWQDQRELMKQRMADEAIRQMAFEVIEVEQIKGLPIYYQTSVHQALDDAERFARQILAQQARKGGRARKTDTLQLLIEKIVRGHPSITVQQLEEKLHSYEAIDTIEDINDGTIWFTNHGRSKRASMAGLKDRLWRARRKLRSR